MVGLPAATGIAGLYTACTLMPVLATLVVLLRFWVRQTRRTKLGWDDWTVLAGLVSLKLPSNHQSLMLASGPDVGYEWHHSSW